MSTRCDCIRDSAGDRLVADARIPKRYQHCTFANYTAYNEQLEKALQYCGRLAERFPVVEKGVLLQGLPGVGKTHLAVATLLQVIRTRGAARSLLRHARPAARDPLHLRPGRTAPPKWTCSGR